MVIKTKNNSIDGLSILKGRMEMSKVDLNKFYSLRAANTKHNSKVEERERKAGLSIDYLSNNLAKNSYDLLENQHLVRMFKRNRQANKPQVYSHLLNMSLSTLPFSSKKQQLKKSPQPMFPHLLSKACVSSNYRSI